MGVSISQVQSDPNSRDRGERFEAEIIKDGITTTTFFLMVDLNGNPIWKHVDGTKLRMADVRGALIKSNSGAKWQARLGVVTRINGTDADIVFLINAGTQVRDTSALSNETEYEEFRPTKDLQVSGGNLARVTSNLKVPGEPLNNTTPIADVVDGATIPEVGDLILKVENVSGGGTAAVGYSVGYVVEL